MRSGRTSLCDGWEFAAEWSEDFANGFGEHAPVRLPHQPGMVPLHYATVKKLRMVCGYRRMLFVEKGVLSGPQNKRLFLVFDGAAHKATVFFNGTELVTHEGGYTPFRVEITELVKEGEDNRIAVRLDTNKERLPGSEETMSDDLAYGGLYREVWLDVRGEAYIRDVSVTTQDNQIVRADVETDFGSVASSLLKLQILDDKGTCVAESDAACEEKMRQEIRLQRARLWELNHPYLYTLRCLLTDEAGEEIDRFETPFGIREARFLPDGFYLNNKKIFLRGLNRYQGYPYIGYAAPKHLQEEDARIIKQELKCNAVRIPRDLQSQHFVGACDRLGLLVFTGQPEEPYRNHPSVIVHDPAAGGVVNFASVREKIIETEGEIFPTKPFDPWEKRQEQALRHAQVLDDAMSSGSHAGCFQWSLCDFQTHGASGSGDRVCYHGVLDVFRNPKTAAAVYTAQGEEEVFLSVACPMDAGDYTSGRLGDIYCFTNAEEVTVYLGDDLIARCMPDRKHWQGLKHPPVLVDIEHERKGKKAPLWQFIATRNGLTKEVTKGPGSSLYLDVRISRMRLKEQDTYDMSAVRVRILDDHGNVASYAQIPVHFVLEGDAELIGPPVTTAEGGMCGTYLRTIGKEGTASLTVRTEQTESVKIDFEIEKETKA